MNETHGITRVCPICGQQKERRREERRNRAGRIIDLAKPVPPHDCRREIRHTTDAEGRKVTVERRF